MEGSDREKETKGADRGIVGRYSEHDGFQPVAPYYALLMVMDHEEYI
jgi:hypothetical protein